VDNGTSCTESLLMPPPWKCSRPGLVEGVPTHGRGLGTRWSVRSLPTQTILWFYDCAMRGLFDGEITSSEQTKYCRDSNSFWLWWIKFLKLTHTTGLGALKIYCSAKHWCIHSCCFCIGVLQCLKDKHADTESH